MNAHAPTRGCGTRDVSPHAPTRSRFGPGGRAGRRGRKGGPRGWHACYRQEAKALILNATKGEAGVQPLRLPLEAAYGALNAALADRVAAARAEASARMAVVLAMEDVVAAYGRFGARLVSDGVEARLVESCLMGLRRAPSERLDVAVDEGGVEAR